MAKSEGSNVFAIVQDELNPIGRPREEVVPYDLPPKTTETDLFKQLHQLDPSELAFRHHFRAARYTLSELGACASDLVWRRAFMQVSASSSPSHEGEDDRSGPSERDSSDIQATIHDIVKNWVFSMPNLDLSSRGCNVTPKFVKLVQILKSCEPYGELFRGIVFVQRQATAFAIGDLLRTSADHIGFLRPRVVVGHGSFADLQLQQETFRGFESGTYNLLVATKSIEDLDIPKAYVVIRFDVFESQVSYAYARACTRGRESHLLHMVERASVVHRRILSQSTQLDHDMQEWSNILCQSQGSSVPPQTLRETIIPYHSDSGDEADEFIEDPTTRGRIYLEDATVVIYRFAASVQCIDERKLHQPLFKFGEKRGGRAYCTIMLPGSPIHGVSGSHSFSVSHARRAACYKACLELHKKGFLDYRLFPLPSRIREQQPAGVDFSTEHPSINMNNKVLGTHCYLRKKPYFWSDKDSATITSLYPTIISTDHPPQRHASMLILTRRPLPTFESFNIFFSGIPSVVWLKPGAEFQLDEARLNDVYRYTIRICRAIANKPFVCPLTNMTYFFAPLGPTWKEGPINPWELPNVVNHIPWNLVSLAAQKWVVELRSDEHGSMAKDIEDAVIQDRWVEFTRRYEAVIMRTDLSPLSKPIDSPREANYQNLIEYCKARRKDFRGLQNYNQPLIEVSKIPPVLNRLNPTSRPLTASMKSPAKYLIPELSAKFTIPASTLRMAMLLPSIIRRIDDLLLVKELNAKFFNHAISEHLLHMAISAPSSGIEYDYERLELLGDAFLKYLSSIYVFVTNPAQNEGALHIARQHIISNKSLLHNAIRAGLPPFIQAKPFNLKSWQPPNFVTAPTAALEIKKAEGRFPEPSVVESGRNARDRDCGNTGLPPPPTPVPFIREEEKAKFGSTETSQTQRNKKAYKKKRSQDEQNMQWLGDKAVADVAEAIIGAAYISGGRETALKVTKTLHIPIGNVDQWSDFGRMVLAPPPDVTAKLKAGSIHAVEAIIGHKFDRPHLLAQALTHSSIPGYESSSYERLEFIGDAILDFLVIRYLFNRDRQLSPGGLTLLKGAMVSNSALAAVCISSGLHDYLLFESYSLASNIQAYADQLKNKQAEEYMLAREEGRPPGQYWLESEPPKALSDVVESIVGAIYVSDNFCPVGAEALFDKILKPFYDHHITLQTLSLHPTKILFELSQAQGCQLFEIIKEKDEELIRCDVVVHDVILASATDSTATFATRQASLLALDALEGDAQFLTRTCDCRTRSQTKKTHKKASDQILSSLDEEEGICN